MTLRLLYWGKEIMTFRIKVWFSLQSLPSQKSSVSEGLLYLLPQASVEREAKGGKRRVPQTGYQNVPGGWARGMEIEAHIKPLYHPIPESGDTSPDGEERMEGQAGWMRWIALFQPCPLCCSLEHSAALRTCMIPAQEQACQYGLHRARGHHESPKFPENLFH